jgi:SAM-dependent methyltransferase
MTTTQNSYVLGSAEAEQARLDVQAEYYRPATLDAMRWAGIRPGMRVLDLGSGTGAVAFAVAELVGPTGSVLGLDMSPAQVRTATRNAELRGHAGVAFVEADLTTWDSDETFDAITGRLITMYLPEPGRAVGRLARLLRPGGVVLLQEFSMSAVKQVPETPLFRRTLDDVLAAFGAADARTDMGLDLPRVFRDADLPHPTMMIGGRWEHGPDAVGYTLLAGIARTLLPVMIARGIASESEVDIDTLEDRLRAAAAEAGSAAGAPLLISAWASIS